jgi:ribonuclease P protein component
MFPAPAHRSGEREGDRTTPSTARKPARMMRASSLGAVRIRLRVRMGGYGFGGFGPGAEGRSCWSGASVGRSVGGSHRAVIRARATSTSPLPHLEQAPRGSDEAYVPAQCPPAVETTRLPEAHVHPRRSRRGSESAPAGPEAPVGLIGRLRDRRSITALRRQGRRARRGVVTVTFLARPGEDRRVAYAVGRHVGGAVERNLVRRRFRSLMADVEGGPHDPGPGDYLVSAAEGAAAADFQRLSADLDRTLDALATAGPTPAGRS